MGSSKPATELAVATDENQFTKRKTSTILKFYKRWEYLASYYANQVYNYERQGYEKDDIIQEFKIKIYTSIIGYAEKLIEYKKDGRYKPVPIEFYLKSAMVNKVKDFVRKFNLEDVANVDKISLQRNSFDISEFSDIESDINFTVNKFIINGIDLLENLATKEEKWCFSLYLRGYTIRDIKNKFRKLLDAEDVIRKQIAYLKQYEQQLIQNNKQTFKTYSFEEE